MELEKDRAYLFYHRVINKLETVSSVHLALEVKPHKRKELVKIIRASSEIVLDTLDRMFRFEIIPDRMTKDKIKKLLDYGNSLDWENPQEVGKYIDFYYS